MKKKNWLVAIVGLVIFVLAMSQARNSVETTERNMKDDIETIEAVVVKKYTQPRSGQDSGTDYCLSCQLDDGKIEEVTILSELYWDISEGDDITLYCYDGKYVTSKTSVITANSEGYMIWYVIALVALMMAIVCIGTEIDRWKKADRKFNVQK